MVLYIITAISVIALIAALYFCFRDQEKIKFLKQVIDYKEQIIKIKNYIVNYYKKEKENESYLIEAVIKINHKLVDEKHAAQKAVADQKKQLDILEGTIADLSERCQSFEEHVGINEANFNDLVNKCEELKVENRELHATISELRLLVAVLRSDEDDEYDDMMGE